MAGTQSTPQGSQESSEGLIRLKNIVKTDYFDILSGAKASLLPEEGDLGEG